jgi:hypothetical protein
MCAVQGLRAPAGLVPGWCRRTQEQEQQEQEQPGAGRREPGAGSQPTPRIPAAARLRGYRLRLRLPAACGITTPYPVEQRGVAGADPA